MNTSSRSNKDTKTERMNTQLESKPKIKEETKNQW